MLDHDDEQRLAEIEAHLRLDAPDLRRLFEGAPAEVDPPLGLVAAALQSLGWFIAAVALTTIVTLALGPNLGGLVAVVTLTVAGLYSYQLLRGCPGARRARGRDH